MLDVVTNLSCLSSSLTKNWLRTLKESQNCLESLNCRCTLYCPNCLYSPFCPYSLYLIVSEHCLSLLSRICDCGVTHKIPDIKWYPSREKVANMVAVAQEFWLVSTPCLNNNNNNSNKNNNNNKSFDLVDPGCVLLIRPLLPRCEYILCSFDVTLALIQTKFWLGQSRMSSFELLWIYLCGFKICLCVTWQTKYVLLRYNQIVFFQLQPDFIPLTK